LLLQGKDIKRNLKNNSVPHPIASRKHTKNKTQKNCTPPNLVQQENTKKHQCFD
jgi:hypothetical protein